MIEELLQRYFKGELTQEEKEQLFDSFKSNPALKDTIQEVLRNSDPVEVEKFVSENALMCDTIAISEEDESMIELYFSGMMEPDEEETFKKKLLSDEEFRNNALAQAFLYKTIQKIRKSDKAAIESAKKLTKSSMQNLFAELKDEDDDELIDNFLKGNLSDSEETQFKQRLQTDSQFKERASSIAMLSKGIHNEQENTYKAIEDARKLTAESIKKELKKGIWTTVLRYGSVAALVLMIAGIGVDYYNYSQVPGIAEENLKTIMIAYNTNNCDSRGAGESMYKALQKLFESVKPNTNLKYTIEKLSVHYNKAIDDYADEEDQYIDVISFALATAYIYDGQRNEAKKVLEHIINDENSDKEIKEKARKLKNSLNAKCYIFK